MSRIKYLSGKSMRMFAGLMLTMLVAASCALAQQKPVESPTPTPVAVKDLVSGKYEGPAKAAGVADVPLSLELANAASKVSGRLITPQGPVEISEGTLADGKLVIKLGAGGKGGMIAARLQDETVVGDWIPAGAPKRTIELKKVTPVSVDLSGEWSALADSQGGFPFLLTLKVEGEKVTGSSNSQIGDAPISSGSWKDGKLAFVLDAANGPIAMSATLVEGKLVGDFDYAGQLQGKWVAARKAP